MDMSALIGKCKYDEVARCVQQMCDNIKSSARMDESYDIAGVKMEELEFNLMNNRELCERVKAGEVTPEALVQMRPWEMAPEVWHNIIARRENTENRKKNMATTDRYFCHSCKNRKCTTWELQTRSADEPMTLFIACLVCGKQWKQ